MFQGRHPNKMTATQKTRKVLFRMQRSLESIRRIASRGTFLVAVLLFATFPALAQTVPLGPRFVLPYQAVADSAGAPLPGALLYFYASGTQTPLNTYSDPLLTTPNPNPVQANASGLFPNIFLSGNYKVVLDDSSGDQIWTADPVQGTLGLIGSPTTLGAIGYSVVNPSSVINDSPIAQWGSLNLQWGSETCGQQLYQLFNPLNGFFANAQVCDTIPAGTTVHQHIAGLFSVLDEAGAGDAIPLIAQAIEDISGGTVWGLNTVLSDAPIRVSCTNFSVSGTTLTLTGTCTPVLPSDAIAVGQRVIDNASAIPAGTTVVSGSGTTWTLSNSASISSGGTIAFHDGGLTSETLQDELDFFVFGASTRARVLFNGYFTQPPAVTGINGNYQAVECNKFSNSLYPWEDCLVSQNGAAVYGLSIGTTVYGNPAATGELSQIVRLGYTDNTTGTIERYAELWADPTHAGSTGGDFRLHATANNLNLILDNTAVIGALNAAGSADVAIAYVDASNNIQFGSGGTSVFANQVDFSSAVGLNGGTGTAGQTAQSAGAGAAKWASLRNYYGARISGVSTTSGYGITIGTAAINTSSPNGVWVLSPAGGTFKNLYVSLTAAPGASQSVQVTLEVAGSATSVTCTISGASATSCSDTTDTATISAGQTYNYQITVSSGNATETMAAGIEFDNP